MNLEEALSVRDRYRMLLLVGLEVCAVTILGACPKKNSRRPRSWPTEVVPHAAGATRLLLSPQGTYALAEIRGRWLKEEYSYSGQYVPGVLKLLGPKRNVVRHTHGWALGAPDDQGNQWIIEEGPQEFRYRVRLMGDKLPPIALPHPAGYWHVKGALRAAGTDCLVAAFWSPVPGSDKYYARRERLWIASIDPKTRSVRATRVLETTLPLIGSERYDHGIAAGGGAGSPLVTFVELPAYQAADSRWRVTALDCKTLKTRWLVPLPKPVQAPPKRRKLRRGKVYAPQVKIYPRTAHDERQYRAADVAFAGDGGQLAVIYGTKGWRSIGTRAVYVLSLKDGRIVATLQGRSVSAFNTFRITPIPGRSAFAVLDVRRVRELFGESVSTIYFGAYSVSLAPLGIRQIIDIS